MDRHDALHAFLMEKGVFCQLFDYYRLVDTTKGMMVELDADGTLRDTATFCTSPFRADGRCKNCISQRAAETGAPTFKLEYLGGEFLMMFSLPIEHLGRKLVVELVRNVSESMTVDQRDTFRQDEVNNLVHDLNRIATTDALTGLFNRRFIDTNLPSTIANCHRYGPALCVAMLDLDNFKQVNDNYFHQGGDDALAGLGEKITQHVRRSSDWAARYGGDEFLICLLGAGLEKSVEIIDRLRQSVASEPIVAGKHHIPVTISCGVCMLKPGEEMKSLLNRCDQLLYQAKAKGRNRVEFVLEEK